MERVLSKNSENGYDKRGKRTLIPLPALQTIDIVTVYHNCSGLIFVNFLYGTTGLFGQGLTGISKYKVDLASDGFRGFGVVACQ